MTAPAPVTDPVTDPAPQRRARILEAAARRLHHYGQAKTTVADIAREAGVSVGAVYLEFPSKDAILQALSERAYGRVLDAMRCAAEADAPFAARLRAVFRARAEQALALYRSGPHGLDLLDCGCAGVQAAQAHFAAQEALLIQDLLARARAHASGACATPDLAATARALLTAHARYAPPALLKRAACAAQTAEAADLSGLDALHDLLLCGLLPRG
jgi:AcrR family transcriptional regulator